MSEKRLIRKGIIERRNLLSAAERARSEADIAGHGVRLCAGVACVAAYAAVGGEPPTRALLDGLREAGTDVLLPAVHGQTLRWGHYEGWTALQPGRFGVLEPAAATADLAQAGLVLLPAVAVDRDGVRLGRGGGYYDRALVGLPPARLVAVVYADEVLAQLPAEPHDVRVGAALTPEGVVPLGQ